MQRIQGATIATDLFGAGKHGFQEGDPEAMIAATVLTAEALNAMQEELARAVEVFGALDPGNHGQLAAALSVLVTPRAYARPVQLRSLPLVVVPSETPDSRWETNHFYGDDDRGYPRGFYGAELLIDLSAYIAAGASLVRVTLTMSHGSQVGAARARMRLRRETSVARLGASPVSHTWDHGTAWAPEASAAMTDLIIEPTPGSVGSTCYVAVKADAASPPTGTQIHALLVESTKTGL